MSDMMTEFLSSAGERAAVVLAEQGVTRSAQERRKAEQKANGQTLQGMIGTELGPVLDVLRSLPEKDGKKFAVTVSDMASGWITAGEYAIAVSYQRPQSGHAHCPRGVNNPWRPAVNIRLALDNGKFTGTVIQHSLAEKDGYGRTVKTSSFDDIRHELGLGIGTFAADRVDEI